jgi:hypothetical protein
MFGNQAGYLIPESYWNSIEAPQRDAMGKEMARVQDDIVTFWTPSVEQGIEAEKAVREFIRQGVSHPKAAFPEEAAHPEKFIPDVMRLAGIEISLIDKNYDKFTRQFVGIRVGDKRRIYCSYFFGHPFSEGHLDISKTFLEVSDGGYSVWQITYDVESKHCMNLEINGPWEGQ